MPSLVSILIPATMLNHGLLIQLGQRSPKPGREKEIIVVDDGSRDRTLSLRESLRRRQCLLSVRKTGASAARNKAFQTLPGDYIQWLACR